MTAKNRSEEDEHKTWLEQLSEFQESDQDNRAKAMEADKFCLDPEGQWEERIAAQVDAERRPKYTFDQTTPAIENIMVDIEAMDFGSKVKPRDSQASKETAEVLEGLVRSIEQDSKAPDLYRKACRRNIRRGFDAWVVKTQFKNDLGFDQEIAVKAISNAISRVWVSNTITNQTSLDADEGYILSSVSPAKFKEIFPDAKGVSVDDADFQNNSYEQYKPKVITYGQKYYKKEIEKKIAQLSNGDVVEVDDNFNSIVDDLALSGVTVKAQRVVKSPVFFHRFFDGAGFISKERKTVFTSCPIVTLYGNFELLGDSSKIHYSGKVGKLMDYQRVLNYSKSKEVEESALSPIEKIWMTKEHSKGHQQELNALNVSSDPVQFYNHIPDSPSPFKMPRNQVSVSLSKLSEDMSAGIQVTSGTNNAMNGQFAGRLTEEALRMQIERGSGATRTWVNVLAESISRTCQLIVDAIPKVYDTKQTVTILGEDGSEDLVTLNDEVYDNDTKRMVQINNLSKGDYKVTCTAGKSFTNRLEAGLSAMLDYAKVDPSIVEDGSDLMLKAIDAPLVDQMAERRRARLLQAGMIPPSQMTDEEKEHLAQQQQQEQPPGADEINAQANLIDAQAQLKEQENRENDNALQLAKAQEDARHKDEKIDSEINLNIAKIQQKQQEINDKRDAAKRKDAIEIAKLEIAADKDMSAQVKSNEN